VEILVALYFKIMKISKTTLSSSRRDRFILSKGHACPALYAVLAEKGFLNKRDLDEFAVNGGIFQQHPDRDLARGIEFSTGSLGHGLSVAAGVALDIRVRALKHRVFTLMGDGELNEGAVWEAAIFASQHKLANLIAIVDHNKMQAMGHTKDIVDLEPLKGKWEAFGWYVQDIDGHDFAAIFKSFGRLSKSRPNLIVMHTMKGKGVSFMENDILWHYRYPRDEEYTNALKELYR
jgi:transketolase